MCFSTNMIVLIDNQGTIQRFNKAYSEYLGKLDDEIGGSRLEDHFPGFPIVGEDCESTHQDFLDPNTGRWLAIDYYLCTNSNCSYEHAIYTIRDISGEVKAAQRDRDAHLEMERIYRELKATQTQVIQQEKLASIGQLAAGVAHEINNPVGFIGSNLNALLRYQKNMKLFMQAQQSLIASLAPSENQLAELARARKSLKIDFILDDVPDLLGESLEGTNRVSQIVHDLKAFSRADLEEKSTACLNDCIETTLNVVWNELKYKATLEKDLADIPPVLCFPNRINQVLINLLVNAAHAIETQGTIRLRSWQAADKVLLSVSDTGSGILPENIDRLFEPFFTTKEAGKGTGLGLSISYGIIQEHGGVLRVESEPGHGATFTIELPMAMELESQVA